MSVGPEHTAEIAAKVEAFVRDVVVPYEKDPSRDHHDCPSEELVAELKEKARAAGVLTPHILAEGRHLSQRETAIVLQASGTGVTSDNIVEEVFREIRAFRIYDGPTEIHKWSLAKKIKKDWKARHA